MWKLWNKLFGWDYIYWENFADQGVAKVRKGHNGEVWYYRYWITSCVDRVRNPERVIWLTCHPSKYLGENK